MKLHAIYLIAAVCAAPLFAQAQAVPKFAGPADSPSPFVKPTPAPTNQMQPGPGLQAPSFQPQIPQMQGGMPGIPGPGALPAAESFLPNAEKVQVSEAVGKALAVLRVTRDHAVFRLRDGQQESYPMYSDGDTMYLRGAEYTIKIVGANESQYRVQLVKPVTNTPKKGAKPAKPVVFAEMWPESATSASSAMPSAAGAAPAQNGQAR